MSDNPTQRETRIRVLLLLFSIYIRALQNILLIFPSLEKYKYLILFFFY